MEFLVRVQDKINTQVFCLNPVHKGNHMDRVSFKDETFEAVCPDCGSNEFLYRKNNAISKKGHFITFKENGWSWGTNELKHYGIAEIDCTYEQAKIWCQTIENERARTEAKDYREQADVRRGIIISSLREEMLPVSPVPKEEMLTILFALKLTIQKNLKSDPEYLSLKESERQAENLTNIDHRHRKRAFDFEKVLTAEQLSNWNDMNKDSEIINISEQDKSQIKEIQWL